jgi:hypothetical protein
MLESQKVCMNLNFMLVVLLYIELTGSFMSIPADNLDKFTPPLPELEKLFIGMAWVQSLAKENAAKEKTMSTSRISYFDKKFHTCISHLND